MSPADRAALLHRVRPFVVKLSRATALRLALDADDLCQDSLLSVYKAAHTYDPARGHVTTWAALAVRRSAYAHRQTRRPTAPLPTEADGETVAVADGRAADPVEAAERSDDLARVWEAVGRLSARQQQAIVVMYGTDALSRPQARNHAARQPAHDLAAGRRTVPGRPQRRCYRPHSARPQRRRREGRRATRRGGFVATDERPSGRC
jgi:RNA polymerase sigma factor (sigma-70 family)